jgi:SulP family sulfate permease
VSISSPVPGPDEGPRAGTSILAQAVANLAGAFCHALPVGGSLSRSAVAVAAGGRSRWTGLFAGSTLALVVCVGGSWVGRVPLPAIGVLLAVIGTELLATRFAQARTFARTSPRSFAVFAGVFTLGALGPLEYALAVSLAAGVAARAATAVRLRQASLRASRTASAARETVG